MYQSISDLLAGRPDASATIKGNRLAPHLSGTVKFYKWAGGTIVKVELVNLPLKATPFGFHVHSGSTCTPSDFSNAGKHYNPTGAPHPAHAGDLPPIFSNNGYGFMVVFTDRFPPGEVIGKTVVIHMNADDFKTQPDGGAGERIGCGVIE